MCRITVIHLIKSYYMYFPQEVGKTNKNTTKKTYKDKCRSIHGITLSIKDAYRARGHDLLRSIFGVSGLSVP